ncbi:MAG: LytTR family transcriptional regulator DNA-binding domain-containing protein, partial [Sphingobacterium sp.]
YKSKMETIIQYGEIRYATIDDKELTLSLKDEKSFITLLSLNALMDRLPSQKFIRVSASQMVAIQEIKSYSKNEIELKDGNDLLIIQKPEAYDAIDMILNVSKEDGF